MSATNTPAAPDAAFNTLHQDVIVPVFFEKLASHGIRPRTQAEAATLLRIGQQLMAQEQVEQVKEAAAGGSLLEAAAAHLDQVLGAQPAVQDARDDRFCKAAALQFAAQADLLQAAAVLNTLSAAG